jgi:hypothetical protein
MSPTAFILYVKGGDRESLACGRWNSGPRRRFFGYHNC